MTSHRIIAVAMTALVTVCNSAAALAAPVTPDGASPHPSPWLTVGCALFLLTTMQRRR